MRARRFGGDGAWASEGLATLPPREDHTAEESSKLSGFLRTKAGRRPYRPARTGGDPLGSGGSEAAHKRTRPVRLQRSGAWWSVEQANHRLALRWAIDNGTLEGSFEVDNRRALQRPEGHSL